MRQQVAMRKDPADLRRDASPLSFEDFKGWSLGLTFTA